jgi:ABC-2 type transport system permease protein
MKKHLQKVRSIIMDRVFRKIIYREIKSYFSTPVAFIVLGLFIIIVAFVLLSYFSYLQFATNDLTQLFSAIAFSYVVIIPALTMGSIAKEKQSGTIEYALTQPYSVRKYLAGKFVSYLVVIALMLLLTLPIALVIAGLSFFAMSPIDFGQVLMQYLGAFILGSCIAAIGVAVSSFFKSEIGALLVSMVLSALFIVIGSQAVAFLPDFLRNLIEGFSLLTHHQSLSRGVLDFGDILYFIVFITTCLLIAYYSLIAERFPKGDKVLKNIRIAVIISLVIAILVTTIGNIIPGRFDLTSTGKYTLSAATREVIANASDIVSAEFYSSGNLPVEFQSIRREIEDLLREYSQASNGKFSYRILDPNSNDEVKQSALRDGLQETIFSIDEEDASQRVLGYFGLVFKYLDKKEPLNIGTEVSQQLEYYFSSIIKKLTNTTPKQVGIVTNNIGTDNQYGYLQQELSKFYELKEIELTKDTLSNLDGLSSVLIANPTASFDTESINALKAFYESGKGIVLFTDPLITSAQTGATTANTGSLKDLFSEYGIILNEDYVYDRLENNQINAGSGFVVQMVDIPLWFNATGTSDSNTMFENINKLNIFLGSSITIDETKKGNDKITKLFETTQESNSEIASNIGTDLTKTFPFKESDGARTVAVSIENENNGRAVIVSDAQFVSDLLLQVLAEQASYSSLANQNFAFGIGAVEWATGDKLLSILKARNNLPIRLGIESTQRVLIIGLGVLAPLALVGIAAGLTYVRRKKALNRVYTA